MESRRSNRIHEIETVYLGSQDMCDHDDSAGGGGFGVLMDMRTGYARQVVQLGKEK